MFFTATVIIGDTASSTPLAVVRSIHLARITDVTWAADGLALMVSSTDNYCSLITFGKGELGEEFCVEPDQPFPVLSRDCFPVLPVEPKPEKPKKKSVKPVKDKEAKGEPKTPTSAKKEPVQSNNIKTMFSAIAASSAGRPSDSGKCFSCLFNSDSVKCKRNLHINVILQRKHRQKFTQ